MSDRIMNRYFRKTIAKPDGGICHDGDCYIFTRARICSCGLIHDLMFPGYEEFIDMYPGDFSEDYSMHMARLSQLEEMELPAKRTPEEIEKMKQELEKVFGPMIEE